MTDKQIIIDGVDVSNFCLVCYYDNKTNELARIEPYYDNDTSMYSDIDSYRYGYNAEITKPEEIIKQLKRKEQECEKLKKIIDEAKNSKLDLKSFLVGETIQNEYEQQLNQLKQTLAEIKEVLQFYNNTTIGIDKGNGKFEFEVCKDNVLNGKLIYCYDTNPAKQALQRISEVLE